MKLLHKILDIFHTNDEIASGDYSALIDNYFNEIGKRKVIKTPQDLDLALDKSIEIFPTYTLVKSSICPTDWDLLVNYIQDFHLYNVNKNPLKKVFVIKLAIDQYKNECLSYGRMSTRCTTIIDLITILTDVKQKYNLKEFLHCLYTSLTALEKGRLASALISHIHLGLGNLYHPQRPPLIFAGLNSNAGSAGLQDLLENIEQVTPIEEYITNTVDYLQTLKWFMQNVLEINTYTDKYDHNEQIGLRYVKQAVLKCMDANIYYDKLHVAMQIKAADVDLSSLIRTLACQRFKGLKTDTLICLATAGLLSIDNINAAVMKRTSPGATIRLLHAILKTVLKGDVSELTPKAKEAILSRLNYISMDRLDGKDLPFEADKLYKEVLGAFNLEEQ
tara:strand:+ start:3339 stop:4508 length:1170 start_codon:yes stop_codon:yes gene_type:complete